MSEVRTVSLVPVAMLRVSVPNNLLRVISNKYVNVYLYMLHTITCLSIFKIVYLSHRYVLSYVNILKYFPGTYHKKRLILAKVTVDRSVLMNTLSRTHLPLNLAA